MSHRTSGLIAALVAGCVISLVPLDAQQQQQQPRQTKYDLIASQDAACTEITNVKTKEHLTALPANVVEPKRTGDGWPDLQGSWTSGAYRVNGLHSIELGLDPAGFVIQCQDAASSMGSLLVDPMKGKIPYQPWAEKKRMDYLAAMYAPQRRMDTDTDILCFARGVPHATTAGNIQFRYLPGYVVIFSNDLASRTRIVPMDRRPHLSNNVTLFMGDSRGRWEGNTLVVETTNNRDGTWFDKHGTFHSEAMKVTERWTMVTQDSLYYEATIEDPTVFTKPWKIGMSFDRAKAGMEVREDSCHSGEQSVDRVVRAGIRAKQAGLEGYHIHVDLRTGKAIRPEEQKYLDESGQPLGHSYAPAVPDEALINKK